MIPRQRSKCPKCGRKFFKYETITILSDGSHHYQCHYCLPNVELEDITEYVHSVRFTNTEDMYHAIDLMAALDGRRVTKSTTYNWQENIITLETDLPPESLDISCLSSEDKEKLKKLYYKLMPPERMTML